jgi:plasmid stabilization system protein ParE
VTREREPSKRTGLWLLEERKAQLAASFARHWTRASRAARPAHRLRRLPRGEADRARRESRPAVIRSAAAADIETIRAATPPPAWDQAGLITWVRDTCADFATCRRTGSDAVDSRPGCGTLRTGRPLVFHRQQPDETIEIVRSLHGTHGRCHPFRRPAVTPPGRRQRFNPDQNPMHMHCACHVHAPCMRLRPRS